MESKYLKTKGVETHLEVGGMQVIDQFRTGNLNIFQAQGQTDPCLPTRSWQTLQIRKIYWNSTAIGCKYKNHYKYVKILLNKFL
jgi:hypothetical protein